MNYKVTVSSYLDKSYYVNANYFTISDAGDLTFYSVSPSCVEDLVIAAFPVGNWENVVGETQLVGAKQIGPKKDKNKSKIRRKQ